MSASKLHHDMCMAIKGHIDPNLKQEWASFKFQLQMYLEKAQIAGIENALEAINLLETNGRISIGNYTVLLEIFQSMNHQVLCNIIKDYTKQIQDARSTNTGPSGAGSNHGNQTIGGTTINVSGNMNVTGDVLSNKTGK